jgi:hypothetical protein
MFWDLSHLRKQVPGRSSNPEMGLYMRTSAKSLDLMTAGRDMKWHHIGQD